MKNFQILSKARRNLLAITALSVTILTACQKDSTTTDVLGNWAKRSEFEGVSRTEGVSFVIGDKVYVGSGFDGTNRLNDFWNFDYASGTWYKVASFPGVARNSAVAFTIDGKAYFGTGYDANGNKLNDFWEYNPSTDTWTQKADFAGGGRYNAVGFAIGSYGYIATGYDGNYLKDNWQYNPATDSWKQVASLTGSKRTEAVAFVHNGLAYVVSGQNNSLYLNDFYVYNPATDSWTEKRKINSVDDDNSYDDDYGEYIKRSNATVLVIDNKAYLVAGNINGATKTVWEYDIANDLWAEKTGLEATAREGLVGFSVNNRGFIVTGHNSGTRFDDCWEFFPNEEQSDLDN